MIILHGSSSASKCEEGCLSSQFLHFFLRQLYSLGYRVADSQWVSALADNVNLLLVLR